MKLRSMHASDIEAVQRLVQPAWGELRPDLRFILGLPTGHGLVAEQDGRIAGSVVGVRNGSVGWLGKLFIAPEARGQGLGTALTEGIMEWLEANGCATIRLIATDMAKPIYERAGFVTDTTYHVFQGPPAAPVVHHPALRALVPSDMDQVLALDREATGEDRSALLAALAPGGGWLTTDPRTGRANGYYIPTETGIGPSVATDPEAGRLLLTVMRGQPAYASKYYPALYGENRAGIEHVLGAGFSPFLQLSHMVKGRPVSWRPEAIWGFINPTLG